MYKRPVILVGLILFIIGVSYPFWSKVGAEKVKMVEPELPVGHTECVESKDFMRSSHMSLLHEWRDGAVREHNRMYTNVKGQTFKKSLVGTCMNCHTSKEKFCDTCHKSVGVTMDCWNCHVAPENPKRQALPDLSKLKIAPEDHKKMDGKHK